MVMMLGFSSAGALSPLWLIAGTLAAFALAWVLGYLFLCWRRPWSAAVGRAALWVADLPILAATERRFPRLHDWLARRLATSGYFGLHLTLGLCASIAALALFVSIAEDTIGPERLVEFDLSLAARAHAAMSPDVVRVMTAVSFLGSPMVVALSSVAVVVVLAGLRRWWMLAAWVCVMAGGGILDAALKFLFKRPRPELDAPFVYEGTWSFPSGHSMGSMLFWGMLAYLVVRVGKTGKQTHAAPRLKRRAAIIALAAVMIVAIGVTRILLGAHYFSDVAGGYAAGAAWVLVCITGLETVLRGKARAESPVR